MSVKPAFIKLPHKSASSIAYHFFPPTAAPGPKARLLVFCNGMVGPQMSWMPTIQSLLPKVPERGWGVLTYDRFGQAMTTDRDPSDSGEGKDPKFGHDLNEVVRDLHSLIGEVSKGQAETLGKGEPELVLVGNSIGCAIARHFAGTYPGRVAGILLLDSILANSDFHNDVFPDPDSSSFRPQDLPDGLDVDTLRQTRQKTFAIFSPTNANGEGFDRRNMKDILPRADEPKLQGPGGQGPYLMVVGHEPEKFAAESKERMGFSEVATKHYTQPAWDAYNAGLVKTSDRGTGKVVIAEGCGHVIQLAAPGLVAGYFQDILKAISWV